MSIRSLSIPDKKLSVVIYAKTTNVQSATSSELTSEVADITTINCENVSTDNIYATSINELDLSLDLMPTSIGAPNQVLSRAPNFNPEDPETFKTVWQTVGGGGGGGNVTNPLNADLNAGAFNINNINTLQTYNISSIANFISCLKELNMYAPINMRDNSIFNVDKLTGRNLGVDLNLDMIPATQGVASQVLARSPVYDPNNPATYKLVWQTPSGGGGGVQNPMNTILDCNGFGLFNVGSLTSQNSGAFNIALNGNILSTVGNSLSGITSISGFNSSMTLNGDIKIANTFKTNNITPVSGTIINADCNMTFTANKEIKVALLTTTTIKPLSGTVVNADCSMTFTANKQLKVPLLTTDGITALDSQLVLIGRNQINDPVPVTISASDIYLNNQFDTSPLPKTTVHLNGTLTVDSIIPYNNSTLLTLTSPTLFLDAPQTITSGDIVLQSGKKVVATRTNTDYIGSLTNTPLTIMALTDDAKTQTSIRMASPVIQLDNPNGAVNETNAYISGNLTFNNPVSNPYITGRNLYIYSRTGATPNVNTPLNITSSTCTITQETLNLSSSINNNIIGTTNFDKNINLMSGRGAGISPPMILYRTYGPAGGPFDITDATIYRILTLGQLSTSRGSNLIPVGGYVVGDIYKITLLGFMSTSTSGNISFYVNFGTFRVCSFTFLQVTQSNNYFEFTATFSFREISPGTYTVGDSIGKLTRSNFNTLIINGVQDQSIGNSVQAIHMSAKQSQSTATGSISINNYIIENF